MSNPISIPIGIDKLLALRSDLDLIPQGGKIDPFGTQWRFAIRVDGILRFCDLDESESDYINKAKPALIDTGLLDASVEMEEVRFAPVMDWANKSTWDCRTHGFRNHRPAGAVLPYDDVNFRWKNANDETIVYLYMPNGREKPGYWKIGDGTNPVNDPNYITYFPQDAQNPQDPDGDWKRVSDSVVVTNSLVVIEPYYGYKIKINQTKVAAQATAQIASALHFRFHSALTAALAQAKGLPAPGPGYYDGYYLVGGVPTMLTADIAQTMGLPEPTGGYYTGMYVVKDFVYNTPAEFQRLANYTDVDGSWVFDYARTCSIVVDSRYSQRIEIELETTERVTGTTYANATHIGMNIRTF